MSSDDRAEYGDAPDPRDYADWEAFYRDQDAWKMRQQGVEPVSEGPTPAEENCKGGESWR